MKTTETTNTPEVSDDDALDFFSAADLEPQLPYHEIKIVTFAGGKRCKVPVKRLKGKELIKTISDGINAASLDDRLAMKLKRCVLSPGGELYFTDVSVRNYIETCEGETLLNMVAAVHEVNPLIKNG